MADIPKSVIDTLIAEAIGEGDEGMRRVAETILNRSAIRGLSPEQVVQQPYQYTGYSNPGPATVRAQQDQTARSAAEAAWILAQQPGDPTGGADHYFNPNIVQPRWANSMTPTGQYGNHAYYSSRPIPPGEIPNTVGTALSTVPTPRVAPTPRTMSDDLGQMRNPLMSLSAKGAQVTPSANTPLPRPRPSVADIVTPTMSALSASRRNQNATRAVDMLASTQNSVTPRLTESGDNIYSYHIPDMTPTTLAGGLGSLTPSPARVRLPELPPSNIGQPPTTRVVQSVPFNSTSGSMPRPTTEQLNDAARRASLAASQGYIERNVPVRPQSYAGTERFPPFRDARLAPGVAAQNYNVALNGPPGLTRQQFAALNSVGSMPPLRVAPVPMAAAMRPMPILNRSPVRSAVAQGGGSPLRVVVNGAGTYRAPQPQPMTVVQALQSSGLSPSQAYAAANAQNNMQTVEDRVRGSSSSGGGASSIYG